MGRFEKATAAAIALLALIGWSEISSLKSQILSKSRRLDIIEYKFSRYVLERNLHDDLVSTFGGYICRDGCDGHFSGFSWAEGMRVKEVADCRNLTGSAHEGCLVYIRDRFRRIEADDPFNRVEILPKKTLGIPPLITFGGDPCSDDCSGHAAGFIWARTQGLKRPYGIDTCMNGTTTSFMQGCMAYLSEPGRDPSRDDQGRAIPQR